MNPRLLLLKNKKLKNSQMEFKQLDFSESTTKQAVNGNIALHKNSNVELLLYKLDHPAIIGNLREEGELLTDLTERSKKDFQFYSILSCTLLPPTKYLIAQQLYENENDIFVGFDIRHAIIKNFCVADGWSEYKNNKHHRPSYKMLVSSTITDTLFRQKPQSRYEKVMNLNLQSAEDCTAPADPDDSFSLEPTFTRGMNELLLKINFNSMICIGTTASELLKDPAVFLKLVLIQQDIKKRTGISYPIMIYNNDKETQKIDFLNNKIIDIQPNQFVEINAISALKVMSTKFKNKIWSNYYKKELVISDIETMLTSQKTISNDEYKEYSLKVNQGLKLLSNRLREYTDEDNVLCMHKENVKDANEYQQYLEINQTNLKGFIQNKVLTEKYSPEDVMILCKAYNLQFRLYIYNQLVENKLLVNYGNIDQDLHWLSKVLQELEKLDKKSVLRLTRCHEEPVAALANVKEDSSAKILNHQ